MTLKPGGLTHDQQNIHTYWLYPLPCIIYILVRNVPLQLPAITGKRRQYYIVMRTSQLLLAKYFIGPNITPAPPQNHRHHHHRDHPPPTPPPSTQITHRYTTWQWVWVLCAIITAWASTFQFYDLPFRASLDMELWVFWEREGGWAHTLCKYLSIAITRSFNK